MLSTRAIVLIVLAACGRGAPRQHPVADEPKTLGCFSSCSGFSCPGDFCNACVDGQCEHLDPPLAPTREVRL